MILQVHDELNFSVVPEEKEKVQQIVMEENGKSLSDASASKSRLWLGKQLVGSTFKKNI